MKKDLLLLHGALGSKNQFQKLKSLLNGEFEIHDFNFIGHGGSPLTPGFSIPDFTQQLIHYVQSNQLTDLYIFGYSMGGYVALNACLQISSDISKIVTLGTKFDWGRESTAQEIKMLNPDAIESKVPHYAEKLKQEHAPEDWKSIVRATADLMTQLSEKDQLRKEDFKSIYTSVILGRGKLDKMVSEEETIKVSRWLPNSRVVQFDDVKHPIESVDPQIIADFMKRTFM